MLKLNLSSVTLARFVAPIVYAAGLAALTLCDIVASSFLEVDDVALWSRVRAINGILAIVCLMGLDQFLIRTPQSAPMVKRLLTVQIPLLAFVAATVASGVGFVQSWPLVASIAMFSSASIAMSQFYRARSMLSLAQLSQQSWKFVFVAGLVVFVLRGNGANFSQALLICSALSLVSLFVIAIIGRQATRVKIVDADEHGSETSYRNAYAISLRLMAISSLTAFSLYLEQIAVNVFGTKYQAAIYFTHTTYFLFSSSFLNGYLAFLAGPWARNNHGKFLSIMKKYSMKALIAILLYISSIQVLSYVGWRVIGPTVENIDPILLSVFSISAIARTIYTYPGAYFSAFGSKRHYTEIAMWYAVSLLSGAVIFCLLRWAVGVPVIYAVAFASAFNWVLRSALGMRYVSIMSSGVRVAT